MFSLTEDDVRVEWEAIGESLYGGEVNPDDPDDVEVLRFYVLKRNEHGEWEEVADASYCTRVPTTATAAQRKKGLEVLMNRFHDPVMEGESVKKLGEEMSWISLEECK
jgi:hypothetical protein